MRKMFRLLAVICVFACAFSVFSYKSVSASAVSKVNAYSKAECVMEVDSRRVLYEERGDIRLPMASTTKILTCITVLNLCDDLDKEFEIPIEAVGIEGSSVYLNVGDKYSVRDLLYGLMLRSGNDCATALALYCGSSIEEFTTQMNGIAQKAGALNSYFKNPHGLPCEGHYTTAQSALKRAIQKKRGDASFPRQNAII